MKMFSARAPDAARGMHDFKRAGERVGKTPEIFNGSLRKEAPGPSPHACYVRDVFFTRYSATGTRTLHAQMVREIYRIIRPISASQRTQARSSSKS